MFVVLDTNIFYRDFLLRSNAFRILLESLKYVPARLCVPEIVLDETVAKYREALGERLVADTRARRRVGEILLQPPLAERPVSDEHAAVQAYEAHLKARLAEAGTKFLPYPEESHKKVVERALRREKPFDTQGRGYRDYLIWASLRAEMSHAAEESVVLVTANTGDFCDGDALAESLRHDLARNSLPEANVSVMASLEAFNAEHVLPTLKKQEELRAALLVGGGSTVDLPAWAAAHLLGLLRDEDYLGVVTHGVEPEHASVYVSTIGSLDDVTVLDVRAMSPTRHLVIARARVKAVLSVDVDGGQYSRYPETRELVGDYLEPSASASWYETVELAVRFSLVLNEDGSNVIAAEIDAIDGPAGKIETKESVELKAHMLRGI